MNKPPAFSLLLGTPSDRILGSVETPPLLRLIRPTTFVVWLVIFCVELQTVISTGQSTNILAFVLSTLVFAAVHVQFWYEESEQGRRFHRVLERMRGRLYEDEETGLPNSRHFVFELRRQMTRSVRSGHAFSLVLTDIGNFEKADDQDRILRDMTRALRQGVGESDFAAHLQGAIFAAILLDESGRSAANKADQLLGALGGCIPMSLASTCFPVISLSGYQGELEVRDYLRRAQRDLVTARSQCMTTTAATISRTARAA